MRSTKQGVYIAPLEVHLSGATSTAFEYAEKPESIHIFVYRREDKGPTGFRSDTAAGQVMKDLVRESWVYDFDAGQFRGNVKSGTRIFDAVPKLTIHQPDADLVDENAKIEPYRRALKAKALRKKFGRPTRDPDIPKLIELGLGRFKPIPGELLRYFREHCQWLLVGAASEWGSYFFAINGTVDAKVVLTNLLRASGIAIYEVQSERDLPVW